MVVFSLRVRSSQQPSWEVLYEHRRFQVQISKNLQSQPSTASTVNHHFRVFHLCSFTPSILVLKEARFGCGCVAVPGQNKERFPLFLSNPQVATLDPATTPTKKTQAKEGDPVWTSSKKERRRYSSTYPRVATAKSQSSPSIAGTQDLERVAPHFAILV